MPRLIFTPYGAGNYLAHITIEHEGRKLGFSFAIFSRHGIGRRGNVFYGHGFISYSGRGCSRDDVYVES